jgi:hypothetical protein
VPLVTTLALLLHAASATPQERYRVAPGCPSEQSFEQKLRERLEGVTTASGYSTEVHVERAEATFRGSVRVLRGSTVRVRTLSHVSCSELIDALALSAALAIEELEQEKPAEPAQATPERQSPSPPLTPHPAATPRIVAGVSLPYRTTVGPAGAFGVGAFLGVEAPGVGFAPAALLHFYYHAATARGATGSAELTTIGAALDACAFRVGDAWSFTPCGSFEIASMRAEARGVALPKNPARVTFSVGAGGRGRFQPIARLALGADLGLVVPLVRHRFVFDSGEVVFQLPRAGLRAGLSAAYLF